MSIVVVSDVHLGLDESNDKKFTEFLNSLNFDEIDDFVLLGDIIDIWRRDMTNVVLECFKPLELLTDINDQTKMHYIAGNHDLYFLRIKEVLKEKFPFDVKKSTTIRSIYTDFYFTHGYQLEVLCNPHYKSLKTYEKFSEHLCLAGDDIGNAADALWKMYTSSKSWISKLEKVPEHVDLALKSMFNPPKTRLKGKHNVLSSIDKLAKSNVRHFLFGIKPEEFLIYGHTHRQYVDMENRVANSGCWGTEDNNEFTYIEIIDDVPRIMKF